MYCKEKQMRSSLEMGNRSQHPPIITPFLMILRPQ
jgi:hypothetical protein